MDKLLIISGPTATGKTDLGIHLAKKFQGEIISADSRQVFRGMDIGTGKDIDEKSQVQISNFQPKNKKLTFGFREKEGIPIWLLDVVDPDYSFNVGEYQQLAKQVIEDIRQRGRLPVLVGGTGLYIKAITQHLSDMIVPPDTALRETLSAYPREELGRMLKDLDPEKWEQMNESDRLNPRRLVRAVEIYQAKQVAYQADDQIAQQENILHICLTAPSEILHTRIDERVGKRVKDGIIEEIRSLLKKGYTWELPSFAGLGYRQWKDFFDGKESEAEAIQKWKYAEHQYARRQMIWFKKQKDIQWFDITKDGYVQQIEQLIQTWYTSHHE